MRKIDTKNLFSTIYLFLLLLWGVASFFLFGGLAISVWPVILISLVASYFIVFRIAKQFLLVYISFLLLYGIYGFQFIYSFPFWLALMLLVLFTSALLYFLYSEQENVKKLIPLYLGLFALINIEIYLTLSFWLVNPLSRAFIASLTVYLFAGYLESINEKNFIFPKFKVYLFTSFGLLAILLMTSTWGR